MSAESDERTFEERVAAYASRPEAVLVRSGPEVLEWTRDYTAAFVVPGPRGAPPTLVGSGVFVAIDKRRFMLTAGHCVRDARNERVTVTYPGVPRETTWDLRRGFIARDPVDAGYFELQIPEWQTLQAEGKVFASHRRILVEPASTLSDDDDYVVAGFPESMSMIADGQHVRRFHVVATSVAGRRGSAASAPRTVGAEVLDLAIDRRNLTFDLLSPDRGPAAVPELSGSSGGPCWKALVRPDPSHWSVGGMKLVGTYVGRIRVDETPDRWWFARSVLVGHHLRLIARDYPDLADFIFSTWPPLASWTD